MLWCGHVDFYQDEIAEIFKQNIKKMKTSSTAQTYHLNWFETIWNALNIVAHSKYMYKV